MTYLKQQQNVRWEDLPEEIPSDQAAQILGISPMTLRGYVHDGAMAKPIIKRGVGNKSHYAKSAVMAFYDARESRAHEYGAKPPPAHEVQVAMDAITTAEAELAAYQKATEKEIKRLSRVVVRRREELVEVQHRLHPPKAAPRAKWSLENKVQNDKD